MTTEVSRTSRDGADGAAPAAVGDGRGGAPGNRPGSRTKHGSVTSVAVVPLWDRFRTGVRA
ncbi:hypothetical protein AQI94_10450 [Streptomyces pseudovenezuelae]|uniref:Uncharacterized protein n=1 Tax=Streptomyces pseudovenezuelae TaxID=67350 RepID=A0A101N9E8_9ACTN|nr:hypothetical protein AQI94_10450 [Streptomyces pseudovenezuelae]